MFFELEIWQSINYFFVSPARSTTSSPWEPIRTVTLQRRTSIQLNKTLTVLKTTLLKRTRIFFELEIWQPIKYFFLRPDRSTIRSPWEPTNTNRLLRRPSTQLNKSLTVLKTTFYENAPEYSLSSKSDNLLSTFFSDQLGQQLALQKNLLGL